MIRPGFLTCLLALVPCGAAVNLTYVELGAGGSACCIVPDGAGNTYVVGSAASATGTNVSVTKLDSANRVAGSFTFGGGASDRPQAAALDPQGNLVIAGQTSSPDFPLVHAAISQTEPGATAGFVAKVNPANGQILFSTRVGGVAAETAVRLGTVVNAVAVDPAGNVYAGGMTNAKDFPVSADGFQKSGAGGDAFGPRPYGFVLKLPPAGDRLLYSTLLGGGSVNCLGGSHCIGKNPYTTVNAIVVDAGGLVTAAGSTNAIDFPATAGAVQTVCHCQEYANNGFVTRINASGSGLVWSTFLGGTWYGFAQVPSGTSAVMALTRDAAGNILAAGRTDEDDFPATAGVVQPKFAGQATLSIRTTDGFVTKLNPTGTALVFSTYLGGSAADQINDVQLDAAGNVWVTGVTASSDFPGAAASFTGSFFAEVSGDGVSLLNSQLAPAGGAGQEIRTGSSVTVLGAAGSVLQAPGGQVPGVAVLGIASAAGSAVKGAVAPGEFVSLYGTQLGPSPGAGAILDGSGRIASQLAGVQVLFDGIAAPLLYAGAGQINALVPYGIAGSAGVSVQVTTGGGNSAATELYVRSAQPEVFHIGGAALALNQDGSINSSGNPAAPGSVVTVFASGAGLLNWRPADGTIASGTVGAPIQPVAVLAGNRSLEVLYAGIAPGLVVNTLQVNFRLPQQSSSGPFQLMIDGYISDGFSVAMQ
ncbi:MAG: SBBP repeat-containing protein [Acidobacteriota bacterium]|nr:SBBP repeat-containing protein [Acidobacteriota bacterium]